MEKFCSTSCEQPDGENFINTNDQSSFVSNTGNSDVLFEEFTTQKTPILQMHFDAKLGKEDVLQEFDLATQDFISSYQKSNGSKWFYKVLTFTGTKSRNSTKGNVLASVFFNTDKGIYKDEYISLMNTDDRKGGWDLYLFSAAVLSDPITWIEVKNASVSLQGKDEWFLKYFEVYIFGFDQNVPTQGNSRIVSEPYSWLDNTCELCWDTFYTQNIGVGRMIF